MAHGRWYPTLVMLGDGRVVVGGGLNETGVDNRLLEVMTNPDTDDWKSARPDFGLPLYPHLFLLGDGQLFFTGGKMDTEEEHKPFRFAPLALTPAQVPNELRNIDRCNQSASVLLRRFKIKRSSSSVVVPKMRRRPRIGSISSTSPKPSPNTSPLPVSILTACTSTPLCYPTEIATEKFPKKTLCCGDAGFVGSPFWKQIVDRGHDFLVRVGANVHLVVEMAEGQRLKL